MNKVFFIADTHFGEDTIRRYENRPFETTDEMDKTLIRNWNLAVFENDEVFLLGDIGADKNEAAILAQLNGKKYLVKGNHDLYDNEYYRKAGFAEVYDMPVLYAGFWILSHEPLYVNRNMPYANLFGHIHNNPIIKDFSAQHFCVSAERIGYTPIEFEKIKNSIMEASK